jgi:hypothetical protein
MNSVSANGLARWLRLLGLALVSTFLFACGGGGGGTDGSGTPPFGGPGGGGTGTGSTAGPTLALTLSSATITAQSPATLTATVRDAAGAPIQGVVVALTTTRSDIGLLSAVSVLTDSRGMGSVIVQAAGTGVTGADLVSGIAALGTTTIQGRVGFSVTGASATLQATIDTTTLRGSAGPVRFAATVRDAVGAAVAGQIVSFSSSTGAVRVAQASALTDTSGVAATTVTPADASVGVADSLVASTIVNGKAIQSAVNVQVLSETPSIALTLTPGSIASTAAPITVTAAVRDASGQPVTDAVVSFSTQFKLGVFSAATAATAAGSGSASVVLSPALSSTTGADVVVASVTVAGVTKTADRVVQFVGSSVPTTPTLVVDLNSTTVTPASSAIATVTLKDGSGKAIQGGVVTVTTARGNLATLDVATLLTGVDGSASVTLRSATSGVAGADEVVATAKVNGTSVQGQKGFTVSAAAPTLRIDLVPDAPLKLSAGPSTLRATVLDASGIAVVGVPVKFSSTGSLVSFSAPSAVTKAGGVAEVTVTNKNTLLSAADTLVANVTVGGRDLQSSKSVDLVSEVPSLQLAFTGSSVSSSAAPAEVRATVRNALGLAVPNAIVSFSTQSGLGVFAASTVATDGSGQATVKVSPAVSTATGADTVVATTTLGGVTVSQTMVIQFAGSGATGLPVLRLRIDSTSISSASPTNVTATLTDATGAAVPGQVVTFAVVRGLARTNVATALTKPGSGDAVVVLAPASPTGAGADEVTATVSYAGKTLSETKGFEINATSVAISFTALPAGFRLAEYGQTPLTVNISGASVGSPVNISVSSSCISQGKATLSPSTFTATSSSVVLQYRDNGCGALQTTDEIQAVVVGAANTAQLSLPLSRPGVSSLGFVSASPEQIFLRGSGFTEASVVTFEVRDAAGNPLKGESVDLVLLTGAGDVRMEGKAVGEVFTAQSDALGRVAVRVNSGTQPTPVRIRATITLPSGVAVSTVSSNLSVGIGLPSQLNFSLSQGTKNIEGYSIDGTTNTYQIIAADRVGNPVPAGTSINFVTEGGQVEAIRQIQIANGIARTTANFVSSEPRPVDGRVTITSYALGEESFLDLNGNNIYDPGEPFQDLGNVFKDRIFDGSYDPAVDEYVPLGINNSSACAAIGNPLLDLNASMPSVPATCDGVWSGAGKVYVRRATETVLSTSSARTLWASTTGLDASCGQLKLQVGPTVIQTYDKFTPLTGSDTWYSAGQASGSLNFIVADANPGKLKAGVDSSSPTFDPNADYAQFPRFNPMAAGTLVSAVTPTTGLKVTVGGGSPVPNTSEASLASVAFNFESGTTSGIVFVTFLSPSGLGTTYGINLTTATRPSICPR